MTVIGDRHPLTRYSAPAALCPEASRLNLLTGVDTPPAYQPSALVRRLWGALGLPHTAELQVSALAEGLSGDACFRGQVVGREDWVFKVAALTGSHRANMAREANAAAAAAVVGAAPAPVVYHAVAATLVVPFLHGGPPGLTGDALQNEALLRRLGTFLKRLHGQTFHRGAAPWDGCAYWLGRLREGLPNVPLDIAKVLTDVLHAIGKATTLPGEARAWCHNDLHRNNLVDDGIRIWGLDWSSAAAGDPCWDVARIAHDLALQAPDVKLCEDHVRCLLQSAGQAPTDGNVARVALLRIFADIDAYLFRQSRRLAGSPTPRECLQRVLAAIALPAFSEALQRAKNAMAPVDGLDRRPTSR